MSKHNFISVQDMIAALEKLPKDAHLAITQSGYYTHIPLAEVYSPQLIDSDRLTSILSRGTYDRPAGPVYIIGHSFHW